MKVTNVYLADQCATQLSLAACARLLERPYGCIADQLPADHDQRHPLNAFRTDDMCVSCASWVHVERAVTVLRGLPPNALWEDIMKYRHRSNR